MTKSELILKIAKEADLKEADVASIIQIFIEEIKAEIDRDGKVEIPGFGNFMIGDQK